MENLTEQIHFLEKIIGGNRKYRDAILFYKSMEFEYFNHSIRKNERFGDGVEIQYKVLREIFMMCPPLTKPITVYRGIRLEKEENFNKKELTFISTSLSKDLAQEFLKTNCCILEITVSPGSKVLPILNLLTLYYGNGSRKAEYFAKEQEVLLDQSASFVLTGTTFYNDKKVLQVVYLPHKFQMVYNVTDIVDPRDKDTNGIFERVVSYLMTAKILDGHVEFTKEFDEIEKQASIKLDEETREAVKWRVMNMDAKSLIIDL